MGVQQQAGLALKDFARGDDNFPGLVPTDAHRRIIGTLQAHAREEGVQMTACVALCSLTAREEPEVVVALTAAHAHAHLRVIQALQVHVNMRTVAVASANR